MGEERHNDNSTDRQFDSVTISEAATLLGVHPNTVRNRVKAGIYKAEKVVTERGPTWMIDRNSLSTNTLTNVTQHVVGGVEGRYLERLLTEFVSAIEKDPERENRLEAVKLRVRALQTQATISSGLILAFSAIAYSIAYWIATPQAIGLLYGAVALLLASVVFSFIYMHGLASTIAVNIERPRNRAERIFEFIYYALSISGIGLGLALFLIFLFLNMP